MSALPVTFALEPRYKEQFAQFLDAGFSAFVAAIRIFPNDAGTAAAVATAWLNDPYVVAYRVNAKENAAAKLKPAPKDAPIKRIEDRLPRMTDDNYLRGERLLAEMSGHIEKAAPPSINIDNSQKVIERVLVVKDHGTEDQWEARMMQQQAKLIEGNTE